MPIARNSLPSGILADLALARSLSPPVEGITAEFGDGLLRVSVPKAPASRARRIEVKARA